MLDFKQLPATESIVNFGSSGMVVSESKNAMSAEVESMIRNSQSILDSVPHHEKTLHACDAMLRELNPQFAREKEQEEKIGALEEKMNGIEGTLGQMMTMLSSALDSNRKTKNKED